MSRYLTTRHFARIVAVGFIVLIAAWAVIDSRRGDDPGIIAPLGREEADALALELARCRTITSEQSTSLESCRRVWAENRRQFFRPTKTLPASIEPKLTAATGLEKIQDRFSPIEAEHQQNEVR